MITGAGEKQTASKKPIVPKVRPVFDSGVGSERLVILELHCVGHCTGLMFKDEADEKALRKLLMGKDGGGFKRRRFALEPDPTPARADSISRKKSRMGEVSASECTRPCASGSVATEHARAVMRKPAEA